MRRGIAWDDIFAGYCDGAEEARELHAVEIRLTPDIVRGFPTRRVRAGCSLLREVRGPGRVAVGLGGLEAQHPPEPYGEVFELAKAEGLGSVPHAGEVAGPASIRGALDALQADRIRHGFRAVERTPRSWPSSRNGASSWTSRRSPTCGPAPSGRSPSIRCRRHGGRALLDLDDDHDTDSPRDYDVKGAHSESIRDRPEAGTEGALCDEGTRERLRAIGRP